MDVGQGGVLLFSSHDNIKEIFDISRSYTNEDTLILEEFVEGLQISSESFLINGKAYTPALSERCEKNRNFSLI